MKINKLFIIIKKTLEEKWCLDYDGVCSTCGMMDVKKELQKYSFKEIIDSYESLDFENDILCEEYQEEIKKIYSFLTANNTVYNTEYDFNEFEESLTIKYPNNLLVGSLILKSNKGNIKLSEYWLDKKYNKMLEDTK